MFTGLIEGVGEIVGRTPVPRGTRLGVRTSLAGEMLAGESLSVNGVCLTVITAGQGEVHADVSPETVRVSSLGRLRVGMLVNLERPLRAGSRLGGHFVQGHVDATGRIEELREEGDCHWLSVGYPSLLAPYIVRKGSIAVDGISLTIAGLSGRRFDVQIVPYTWEHTNLRLARPNDVVNLECDILGKYVVRVAELAGLDLRPTTH